mmetsp:Transcript_5631/g.20492  ORF Transcript_5631/g.20492 Transcript_5631/m.20492 type:complete len:320 (-) Transcript_5631:1966-2925(-)
MLAAKPAHCRTGAGCSPLSRTNAQRPAAWPRRHSLARRGITLLVAGLGSDIELIATDVDGTLLNSEHCLTDRTVRAVRRARELGVKVVLATGKARGPWAAEVLPALELSEPGVFLQGLCTYSGDGKVLHQTVLGPNVVKQAAVYARSLGVTLTAYCGERILCEATNEQTDRLLPYKEPVPEGVGPLDMYAEAVETHKVIFMAPEEQITELRPEIEARFGSVASITKALPGMLELLPLGASKGQGVKRLLRELGVDAAKVLAIGDGENDIEMLQLAGVSVAMGNAKDIVKQVATYTTSSNDDDGFAKAIERLVINAKAPV